MKQAELEISSSHAASEEPRRPSLRHREAAPADQTRSITAYSTVSTIFFRKDAQKYLFIPSDSFVAGLVGALAHPPHRAARDQAPTVPPSSFEGIPAPSRAFPLCVLGLGRIRHTNSINRPCFPFKYITRSPASLLMFQQSRVIYSLHLWCKINNEMRRQAV